MKKYSYFCHEVDEDNMGHPIQLKNWPLKLLKHK